MEIKMEKYLMGLLTADGWRRSHVLKTGKEVFYCGLELKDRQILEDLSKNLNCPIGHRKRGSSELFSINIPATKGSYYSEYLDKERTGIYKYYLNLSQAERTHFIRGFFDGDGGVCIRKRSKDRKPYISVYFVVSSSQQEIKSFLEHWLKENNFKFSIYHDQRGQGVYNYNLSKLSEVKRFYSLIYSNNPKYFLTRKYDIFVSYGFPKMETF